jgi:hypothetical protein
LYPNGTLVSYPKAFPLSFPETPLEGHFVSTFIDEFILKLIWQLHLLRTLLSPNLFPLEGSSFLRLPKKSSSLFHNTLHLIPMTHPWERDLYKPLNMENIQGYPKKMPT